MSTEEVMHAVKRNDLIKGISLSDNPSRIQNSLLFAGLLILCVLLVMDLKAGLLLLGGALFLVTALLNPKYLFFLVISLISLENLTFVESVSYSKLVGIILLAGLFFRLAIKRDSLPKDTAYKYFFLFFLGNLASFAVSKDLFLSVKIYFIFVSLFVLYLCTRYFLKNTDDIRRALNYLFASTLLFLVYVQSIGLATTGRSARLSSGMGDPNEFASYLLVLIPLVIYRMMNTKGKAQAWYWICLIGFLFLLVLTGSRGGILGFIGMAAVLLYYFTVGRFRQMILIFIAVALIAYFFVPDGYWDRASLITNPEAEQGKSISYRILSYEGALKMFFDHPLIGVGLYNFKMLSGDYGVTAGKVVHNMYLEILTGGGLIVFVPFLLILVNSWRKLSVRRNTDRDIRSLLVCLKASLTSFLITSFFLSADHEKILWFLLALISSAYYISLRQRGGLAESAGLAHNDR